MRHGSYRFVASFLAIPLALYLIFVISPFGQAFYYSLTNWTGISPKFDFVGLDNFKTLAHDATFRTALGHNIILLILIPVIVIFLALLFAYLLNVGGRSGSAGVQGVRGNGFYKLAFFLPQVLSVPVIAVIWSVVMTSTDNGLANTVTKKLGLGYVAVPGQPEHRPVLRDVGADLGQRRVLPGDVQRGDVRRSRRTSSRRRSSTARPGSRRSSGSRCRCCGTPSRPRGSTWPSWPWTRTRWSP